MKWCSECNEAVDYPVIRKNDNGVGDVWEEEVCPHCGEILEEADVCPWCGEPMAPLQELCPTCKQEFTDSFWAFVNEWIPSAGTSTAVIDMVFELFGGY